MRAMAVGSFSTPQAALGYFGGSVKTLMLVLLLTANACATTYYVDFATGSDNNTGTSKSAPWKLCPGMNGFGHSGYSHVAGDRFIFKGGVTWTASVLPLQTVYSGTASSYDYYGVDQTWYSGASWSRPIFNGGNSIDMFIAIQTWRQPATGQYITIEGIEFTAGMMQVPTGNEGFINLSGNGNVILSNLYIHNWDSPDVAGASSGAYCVFVSLPSRVGRVTVQNCTINNSDGNGIRRHAGCGVGGALWGVDMVISNEIAFASQGMTHGCELVAYNNIHDILPYYQNPGAHPNIVYADAWYGLWHGGTPSVIRNNYIHNNYNAAGQIYPDIQGSPASYYIYNNVIGPVTSYGNPCIECDPESGPITAVYVYNNTYYDVDGGSLVYAGTGRPYNVGKLAVQNNLVITTSGGGNIWNANVVDPTPQDHNLILTLAQANAAGYNQANLWRTTSSTAPTVDVGVSLAAVFNADYDGAVRPIGSGWDIGAFEYVGMSTNPVISASPLSLNLPAVVVNSTLATNFVVQNLGAGVLAGVASVPTAYTNFLRIASGGSYSLGVGQSQVVTVVYTPTGAPSDNGVIDCSGGGGCQLTVTGHVTGGSSSLAAPPNLRVAAGR